MLMHILHSSNAETTIVQLQHNHTSWSQQQGRSRCVLNNMSSKMSTYTETFFGGTSLTSGFAAFRANVAEKAAKRKIYRTTMSELQNLSNRDLADLGISRSMIKGIALEAAYGK